MFLKHLVERAVNKESRKIVLLCFTVEKQMKMLLHIEERQLYNV